MNGIAALWHKEARQRRVGNRGDQRSGNKTRLESTEQAQAEGIALYNARHHYLDESLLFCVRRRHWFLSGWVTQGTAGALRKQNVQLVDAVLHLYSVAV